MTQDQLCFKKGLTALTAGALLTLTACGGGGGGGGGSAPSTGQFGLNITDAPIDDAQQVVVQFSAVALRPQGTDDNDEDGFVRIDLDTPQQIDLLAQQGSNSATLIAPTAVPAGVYTQLRLIVDVDSPNADDTFIVTDQGTFDLEVPSGEQSGLKLNNDLTIAAGGAANFTVDFDLRKALTRTGNNRFILRPSLRLVDNAEVGIISGTVSEELATDASCTADETDGDGRSVYLFAGLDVEPDDNDANDPEAITAARVTQDTEGVFNYEIGFVTAGNYTVAFTCQAIDDDPEVDNTAPTAENVASVEFSAKANVVVEANATTTENLDAEDAIQEEPPVEEEPDTGTENPIEEPQVPTV